MQNFLPYLKGVRYINRFKRIAAVFLSILIFFLVGCGSVNKTDIPKEKDEISNEIMADKKEKDNEIEKDEAKENKKEDKQPTTDEAKTSENKANKSEAADKNNKTENKSDKPNEKTQKGTKDSNSTNNTSNNQKNNNTFTLIVAKESKGYSEEKSEIVLKKEIEISEKKNAMTYLRENANVGEKGGFIYEINGIHNLYPIPSSKKNQKQKEFKILGIDWFIYLNDKKTEVGANDVYPEKGDVLLFDYHQWDKRELAP